jgi:glutamate:GABA antiporter
VSGNSYFTKALAIYCVLLPTNPPELRRELRLVDLVLFNVVAVLGIQLISSAAHVGPIAVPIHLSAAVLFFVPCVLVVAALSRRFPEEGGFYIWTRHAFGDWHAFLCAWCWWLSVLLYLPTLVLTAAGFIATSNVLPLALAMLWAVVGLNIVGVRVTKWLSNVTGALIYAGGGLVLAIAVVTGVREGPATRFDLMPGPHWDRLGLWAQIAFAYTGLELGSVMGGEVRRPETTIPRAAWVSAAMVTGGYVLGTIALLFVLPPDQISPITGLVDVASAGGNRLGLPWIGSLAAILFVGGLLGKFSTWASGAARVPFVIGLSGALPSAFGRLHPRWGTPHVALTIQAVVCSAFLILTQAGETLRAGWQLLLDLTIVATFLPFVYIFLTAWKFGQRWSGASGLVVTLVANALAFVPPAETKSIAIFELKLIAGCTLVAASARMAFNVQRRGFDDRIQ